MAARKNARNDESGRLNVLLHGAFTFIPCETRILALIPDLPEHVYRAGSWLAETELYGGPEATYELQGVKQGTKCEFPRNKNLFVKFNGELPAKPDPLITLHFPLPRAIKTLRVGDVQRDLFSDPELLVEPGNTQRISTLQVLTYDFNNINELRLKAIKGTRLKTIKGKPRKRKLEDHYWEPAFTGHFVNFHIFSAEEHYHKPSNAKEDLNVCVDLLGVGLRSLPRRAEANPGLQVKVRYLPARGIKPGRGGDLPPGVAAIETEDLATRTQRLAQLGRLLVQTRNSDLRLESNIDPDLAWYGADVLDGGGEVCGNVVAWPPHKC